LEVSIRPRPRGQGKRPLRARAASTIRFNPPPATRPGETRVPSFEPPHSLVSIRPRPRGQGKRWPDPIDRLRADRFNPPPATRPGETSCLALSVLAISSFNPPPATRPGETREHRQPTLCFCVSIRPRPRGQGKRVGCRCSHLVLFRFN